MQLSWSRWRRRAPIASLAAIFVALFVAIIGWASGTIASVNASSLIVVSLGLSLLLVWDSFRLTRMGETFKPKAKKEGAEEENSGSAKQLAQEELLEFLEHREREIHQRQADLNERELRLQQQLQLAETQDIFQAQDGPKLSHFEASSSESSRQLGRKRVEDLQETDRALLKLIEAKTEELFGYIKDNRYKSSAEGQPGLRTDLMREDAIELATAVAKVYRPADSDPLLHTNADSILRAVSRAALQVLVTIENLPIPGGVHQLSFAAIYPQVKRAVDSYALYKDAKPYLDHASTALFVGRLALGANPLTLAAWWGISRAATYGAKQLGEHYINQQLLGVVRQAVEGIAIEVASLYSPQLRFRDVNWIYGVELVELVQKVKMDSVARLAAMKEIATLKMPDEFGRMLLVRWLATDTSPKPDQYHANELLAIEARQLIAERLEKFLLQNQIERFDTELKTWEDWLKATSHRLGIRLRLDEKESQVDEAEAIEASLLSLGSFAVEALGAEPSELDQRLEKSETLSKYLNAAKGNEADGEQTQLATVSVRELFRSCSYEFHPPLVSLPDKVSEGYFRDLERLAIEHAISQGDQAVPDENSFEASFEIANGSWPFSRLSGEMAIRHAAHWSRTDVKEQVEGFRSKLTERVQLAIDSKPSTEISFELVRALISLRRWGKLKFVYGSVRYDNSQQMNPANSKKSLP